MSAEENKAIVRRFLEQVISTRNVDAADGFCAAGLVWHGAGVGTLTSLEAFKQTVGPFFTAFPDLTVRLDDPVADGDQVALRYTWHGTHKGEFFGIPATGKRVEVTGISIYRIAGGKIAEEWWQEDLLGLMQQLGAVPAPKQAVR